LLDALLPSIFEKAFRGDYEMSYMYDRLDPLSQEGLLQKIAQRLGVLGVVVQIDVPIRDAGRRVDALIGTPRGQRIVVEIAGYVNMYNASEMLGYALEHLEKMKEYSKSTQAFLVAPLLEFELGNRPNVMIDADGLVNAIEAIVADERVAALSTMPEPQPLVAQPEVPTIFVAMPFAEEFLDTYEVGMVECF
jgi:hypothetical protein